MKRTINKLITLTVITSFFAITSLYAKDSDKEQNDQIKELQQKVALLEQALNQKNNLSKRNKIKNNNKGPYNRFNYNPFFNLYSIQNEMQELMNDDFLSSQVNASSMDKSYNINTDIKENSEKYEIKMDIPGMDKGKINLEIKGDNLIISGEKNNEIEEKNSDENYFYQERAFGSFSRSLHLSENSDKNSIHATYKNGVLTVSIDKLKIDKSELKKIKIN